MNKRSVMFILLVLISIMAAGCYWRDTVESSEVGLHLDDGVSLTSIYGPGRYTDSSWYAKLVVIDVAFQTRRWTDTSLVTQDKQPISLILEITYARSKTEGDIERMFTEFRREALDDDTLWTLVSSRIPSVAKTITTRYTLDQMLGIAEGEEAVGRATVEAEITELLAEELSEIGVVLNNAVISDIGVDEDYLEALQEKARAIADAETAQQRTLLLAETLKQEEAQTLIDLEIAERQNEINETLAEAYRSNPEYFELEKLRLLAEILGENDLIIYVPEGSDITSVLSGGNGVSPGVIPVPSD